jgi:type II restriction enzyme
MKLGFQETQTPYTSGSQSARGWTERWVRDSVYCPNCGCPTLNPFPNNSPVADFFCGSCKEEYELKSQKTIFGKKVLDGSFRTKCERLAADNNPSLFLLNYDLKQFVVRNFFVVPKHFFVREIIVERKPLAQTARRAGWIGSHILLNEIPQSGKIYLVRDGRIEPKAAVLKQWKSTLFLRDEGQEARGWLIEVMKCVETIGKTDFNITDALVVITNGKTNGHAPVRMTVPNATRGTCHRIKAMISRKSSKKMAPSSSCCGRPRRQGTSPTIANLVDLRRAQKQKPF